MIIKTFHLIGIPAILLFTAGSWNVPCFTERQVLSQTGIPPVASICPAVKSTPEIWVSNATIYKGESFELHFDAPNAPFLGVVDPRGHFFYLVFPGDPTAGALAPLVESKQFTDMNTLNINTDSLTADPYTYGVYTNQPVFSKSGNYTFIMGENLHVDDPGLLDKVVVRYIHSSRPPKAPVVAATN